MGRSTKRGITEENAKQFFLGTVAGGIYNIYTDLNLSDIHYLNIVANSLFNTYLKIRNESRN